MGTGLVEFHLPEQFGLMSMVDVWADWLIFSVTGWCVLLVDV